MLIAASIAAALILGITLAALLAGRESNERPR